MSRKINAKKDEVLKMLRENLDKHVNDYKEAVNDWKKVVKERLMKEVDNLDRDDEVDLNFYKLQKPDSHAKSYQRVIGMLNLDTATEIELTEQEYRNYIEDDWDWAEDFDNTKNLYAKMSGR